MGSMNGWISLHRSIQNHWIWSDHEYAFAWVDLLLLVNHEDKKTLVNKKLVIIKRGQTLTSIRKLSKRWKWGKDRVYKFLRILCDEEMITKTQTLNGTLLTVVNYGKFQIQTDTNKDTNKDTDKDTNKDTNKDTDKPQTININKDNNDNKYPVCFSTFWNIYPRKKEKANAFKQYNARINSGYTEDELLEACKNYADECKRLSREERYIKLGATFLSANEPFVDYLNRNYQPEQTQKPKEQKQNKFNKGMIVHGNYDFAELEKEVFENG